MKHREWEVKAKQIGCMQRSCVRRILFSEMLNGTTMATGEGREKKSVADLKLLPRSRRQSKQMEALTIEGAQQSGESTDPRFCLGFFF